MVSQAQDASAALPRMASRGIAIRRRRISRVLGWSALASFALWFVLIWAPGGAAVAPIAGWSLVATALAWLATRGWSAVDVRRGSVEVQPGKLVVRRGRRAREIPLDSIVEGWVNPRLSAVTLKLRGGDEVRVIAESPEQAQELLAAVGMDASRRTMRQQLGETAFWDILTWLLGPIAVIPASIAIVDALSERLGPIPNSSLAAIGLAVFGVLFTLLFWTMRELVGPAHLTVGSDGITIRQRFGRKFVPFADLADGASIEIGTEAVILRLRGGATVHARTRHLSDDERPQLKARIAHATEIWRAGGEGTASLSQLDRGARTFDAWRDALAALVRRSEDYRRAALTREQVQAALDDASAAAERRIGAALALASGDEATRTRVRIASEACANPRLRVALEAIARGEPDGAAVEAAIAEEERDERRRVAGG